MRKEENAAFAKFTRPKLYRVLERERLFKLLDDALPRGSVWISGPPGAGKTALAASYIGARTLNHIWYQLDAGDDDVANLFHSLTRAVSKGKGRVILPLAQPQQLADLTGFSRRYFRGFFSRLRAPAIVVFDNYHELPAGSRSHTVFELAALELPPGVQLLFLSREAPPARLARVEALDRLACFGWEELKLTHDEAVAIAALRTNTSARALQELFALSQGWAAGFTLALESARRSVGEFAPSQSAAFDTVFNYFACQILHNTAPEEREFLMRSALARHLSAELAQRITGNGNAQQILDEFHRRRLFVDRRGEKVFTYQYHDLFRAFLLRELERICTPAVIDELKKRTAQILEEGGQIEEAALLFQQASDWSNVTRLVKSHAEQLIDEGRWQTLQTWFAGFPERMVAEDPDLLLWSGASYMGNDPRQARELLQRAASLFTGAEHMQGVVRAALPLAELVFILDGSLKQLLPIKETLEQAFESGVQLSAAVQRQAYAVYLDIAVVLGGREALTKQTIAAAEEQLRGAGLSANQRINMNQELLLYSVFAADERLGGAANAALRQLEKQEYAAPASLFFAIRHLGFWRYFRGEPGYGVSEFDRAIGLADRWNMELQSVVARVYRVLALCRAGRHMAAHGELAKLLDTSAGMGAFRDGYVSWAQAVIAAARGDLARALEHAAAATAAMRSTNFALVETIGWSLQATFALRLGRDAEALACVDEARALIAKSTWRRFDALLLSVEAEVAARQGDMAKCASRLRAMLLLTHNRIVATALLEHSDWVSRQLAYALQAGSEPEAARALIRDFELAPPSPHAEHWAWSVKIFVLGSFEVLRQDAPLSFSRKAPKKPLALLKALVCQGGGEVSVARLIDWLWPQSEADAAKKSFEMALSRLRGLLGDATLFTLENGQLSLDRDRVWVDAWAFNRFAEQSAQHSEFALQAVRLYVGGVLPQELDAVWAVSYREKLRSSFNRLVSEEAAELEGKQQYAEALSLYARGLEADDLVEAMHQGLMRCHLALGQRADALAAFQRLRRTLAAKLRTLPSAESTALAAAAQM